MLDRRTRHPIRPSCALALAAVLTVAAWSTTPSAAESRNGPDAKAHMIWNILRFVEWPLPAKQQITLTILGEDELAVALASTVGTRAYGGRNVFVRFTNRPQDVRGSQVVYVAAPNAARWTEVARALQGEAALTLSDHPGFLAEGGMVSFATNAATPRFEIHLGRVEQAGLRISSKVLALAQVTRELP